MKGNILFRVRRGATSWSIEQEGQDPRIDLKNYPLRVDADSILMDAIRVEGGEVLGYLISTHGVPQEQLHTLPAAVVTNLGIGGHVRRIGIVTPGTHRLRLGARGEIESA